MITLTDGNNTSISTQLRVWLTKQTLGDLPEVQ